jgi:uncharacterized alkaline shock family protein YloU
MTETVPTRGKVKVANEVIAQIAALTALQVPGVAGVADRSSPITRVIRKGGVHKGVRLDFEPGDTLRLQLHLVAVSGRALPALAAEVQRRVVSAVERMLGLHTSQVDVYFADIRFESD